MPNPSDTLACNHYASQTIDGVKLLTLPLVRQRFDMSKYWREFSHVIFLTFFVGTNLACCADDAGKSYPPTGEGYEAGNPETQFLTSENPNSENPNEESESSTNGEEESTTEAVDCGSCWACNPPPLSKCIPICTGECDACC